MVVSKYRKTQLNKLNRLTRPRENFKTKSRPKKIKKIINLCNNILVDNEDYCNCKNKKGLPDSDTKKCSRLNSKKKCKKYNLCKKLYKVFMSGTEPEYEPEKWSIPVVEGSHNCYAYFLNDQIPKVKKKCKELCKDNENCSSDNYDCGSLKPQPSHYSFLRGIRKTKNRKYTCDKMIKSVLDDNKVIKVTPFEKPCKKGYYKGYLTVDPNQTYHFYRQDNNVRWSHKQGTLPVENVDASGKSIYAPHLSDTNYNKEKKKDGINYVDSCAYMCIPNNRYYDTKAI